LIPCDLLTKIIVHNFLDPRQKTRRYIASGMVETSRDRIVDKTLKRGAFLQ